MANLIDNTSHLRLNYDAAEDIQIVRMTRAEARAYFDDGKLPETFDAALDLAQAEAEEGVDAIVVILIKGEPA